MEGYSGRGWNTVYLQEWKSFTRPHLVMVVLSRYRLHQRAHVWRVSANHPWYEDPSTSRQVQEAQRGSSKWTVLASMDVLLYSFIWQEFLPNNVPYRHQQVLMLSLTGPKQSTASPRAYRQWYKGAGHLVQQVLQFWTQSHCPVRVVLPVLPQHSGRSDLVPEWPRNVELS